MYNKDMEKIGNAYLDKREQCTDIIVIDPETGDRVVIACYVGRYELMKIFELEKEAKEKE